MEKIDVLYQIKTLENLIFRTFLGEQALKTIPTPTQVQIMEYILTHQDEEIYQRDLENILNLRRATVSGVLQTMEKHGLVKRVTNINDARTKRIILQEEARQKFLLHRQKILAFEELITKEIPEREMQTFYQVLKKMQDNVLKYGSSKLSQERKEIC